MNKIDEFLKTRRSDQICVFYQPIEVGGVDLEGYIFSIVHNHVNCQWNIRRSRSAENQSNSAQDLAMIEMLMTMTAMVVLMTMMMAMVVMMVMFCPQACAPLWPDHPPTTAFHPHLEKSQMPTIFVHFKQICPFFTQFVSPTPPTPLCFQMR